MDDSAMLLLVLLAVLLLGTPTLAVVTWLKVRQIDRRTAELARQVASLTGGSAPVAPAVPPAAVSRPDVPAAAVGEVADPEPGLVPPVRHGPSGVDLETAIAGRWLNRIGLLAVAIGVSYFLKYAIDNAWIGPVGQVTIGVALGVGLIAASAGLLARGHAYFADGLTGLGGSVLYLSFWAGVAYYRIIPPAAGFVAMTAVTAGLLGVAVGRDSQRVAAVAMLGGFLTPLLVGTGDDRPLVLFAYLAVLLAGLLPLARARDWRLLELPAFLFTQVYFWTWYGRFHTSDRVVMTGMIAALFFGVFSAVPVLRSRAGGRLRVDQAVLVLLNAGMFLVALRALLWPGYRWTLTLATLAVAAVHLVMARAVPSASNVTATARLLFAGVALSAVTLAVLVRLEGGWVTAFWAVEAAILMWSGWRARLPFMRVAAFTLFALVALRVVYVPIEAERFLLNARLGIVLVLAGSAAVALWGARRSGAVVTAGERAALTMLGVAANALLIWGLTLEVEAYFRPMTPAAYRADAFFAQSLTVSLLWVLYATMLVVLGVGRGAAALRWQGLALFGLASGKVFFYDLDALSGFYRIVSIVVLGAVLLTVSFLYQRRLEAGRVKERA